MSLSRQDLSGYEFDKMAVKSMALLCRYHSAHENVFKRAIQAQVRHAIQAQVRDAIQAQVRDAIQAQVRHAIQAQVRDSIQI